LGSSNLAGKKVGAENTKESNTAGVTIESPQQIYKPKYQVKATNEPTLNEEDYYNAQN
jgi:hypothetical protein